MFSPAIEDHKSIETGHEDPVFAVGILGNAYTRNPYNSQSFNDVATDDAVTNQTGDSFLKMATGGWTSANNNMEQWGTCKMAIQYLNLFLEQVGSVSFADDERINKMFIDRHRGEALGLRAMNMFYLIQAHGGWTANGELLGVPNITASENVDSDFNRPRDTFEDCVKQIYNDVEMALSLLPLDYEDITSDMEIPQRYKIDGVNVSEYNRVFGKQMRTRMSGRIAMAFRAKAALLAASPAFAQGTTVTWEDAAIYNGELLDMIGGISGLDPKGNTWYKNKDEIDNLGAGENPKEMLWRNGKSTSDYGLEQNQFPPSLYGRGQVNPTQNLVDAFPMANGYPITMNESNYDANNPYVNRDPRLNLYIVVNGSTMGHNNAVINTATDNTDNDDGLNKENGYSTRTGYYLRKHLREDVYLSSTTQNGQPHYSHRFPQRFPKRSHYGHAGRPVPQRRPYAGRNGGLSGRIQNPYERPVHRGRPVPLTAGRPGFQDHRGGGIRPEFKALPVCKRRREADLCRHGKGPEKEPPQTGGPDEGNPSRNSRLFHPGRHRARQLPARRAAGG